MAGIFGGGGQTHPSVYYQGGNPAPYQPQQQGTADWNLQQLMQGLINPSLSFLSQGQPLPAVSAYPQVQSWAQQMGAANPYANQFLSSAVNAGNMATAGGQQQFDTGVNLMNQIPGLLSAGQQVYNTAFDPQQQLYNLLLGQVNQQTNANLANSGLAGTPYGANLANEAATNFGINWQNQQLGRQTQGLQGLINAGQGALGLGQGGAGLENMGIGTVAQGGAIPYNAYNTQAQNALQGLLQMINVGNQQYTIPQQAMNDLQSYLQLGQAASRLAGQLGNQGFGQNLQSGLGTAGLLGGGANLLFGNSLANNGGLLGLAGLSPFGAASSFAPFAAGGVFGAGADIGSAIGAGANLLPFLVP